MLLFWAYLVLFIWFVVMGYDLSIRKFLSFQSWNSSLGQNSDCWYLEYLWYLPRKSCRTGCNCVKSFDFLGERRQHGSSLGARWEDIQGFSSEKLTRSSVRPDHSRDTRGLSLLPSTNREIENRVWQWRNTKPGCNRLLCKDSDIPQLAVKEF